MNHKKHTPPGLLLAGAILAGSAWAGAQDGSRTTVATDTTIAEPTAGPSVIWGDADGDGLQDLYALTPGAEDRLFRNLGNGQFEDATAGAELAGNVGSRVAMWQDFDGDRHLDLLLIVQTGDVRIYRGTGEMRFTDASQEMGVGDVHGASAARWLDYDRDGWMDLHLSTAQGPFFLHNLAQEGFEKVELDLPMPALPPSPIETAVEPATPPPADVPRSDVPDAGATHSLPSPVGTRTPAAPGGSRSSAPSPPLGSIRTTGTLGPPLSPTCFSLIEDMATGLCIPATSIPTIGALYPLGPEFNINSIGHVGIGTDNPAGMVSLGGPDEGYAGSDGGTQLYLGGEANEGANNGGTKLLITNYDNDGTTVYPLVCEDENGNIDFRVRNAPSQGSPPEMYFRGEVGIGTTSPDEALHVAGNIRLDAVGSIEFDDMDTRIMETGNRLYIEAEDDIYLSPDNDLFLDWGKVFYDGSTSRLGIGTIEPGELLDVQGGDIRTSGQLISTTSSGTAPLIVSSDTKVTNLNVDELDGIDSSDFTQTDDGPGVAQAEYYSGSTHLGSGISNLEQQTITCPGAGYVLVIGSCTVLGNDDVGYNTAKFGVSNSTGHFSDTERFWAVHVEGQTYEQGCISVQKIFPVTTADDYTFYLLGQESDGQVRVDERTLSLVYFPKAHGTVEN